ncbi:MAG: TipAS antibiotic-recognition domain-containing protein [Dorea longicatena]
MQCRILQIILYCLVTRSIKNINACTNKILRGLGKMYSGGGDITTNIDVYGGKGTANFVSDAIEIYCDNAEKMEALSK